MVSLFCWGLTPRVATRSRRSLSIRSAAEEAWSAAEDAALLDDNGVPSFTVGDGGRSA